MTPERLRALIDAYGADAARWPLAERDAARALLAASPERWRTDLASAAELDDLLRLDAVPGPSLALQLAIERSAPGKDARRPAPRWWWPSLGLAGVGAAGALAGVLTMSVLIGLDSVPGATASSIEASDQTGLTDGSAGNLDSAKPGPLSALAYATTGFDDAGLPGDKQ
jgi:hypothetical protein